MLFFNRIYLQILVVLYVACLFGQGFKVLHEANSFEELPLQDYDLSDERLSVRWDNINMRVMLMESQGPFVSGPYSDRSGRKLMQTTKINPYDWLELDPNSSIPSPEASENNVEISVNPFPFLGLDQGQATNDSKKVAKNEIQVSQDTNDTIIQEDEVEILASKDGSVNFTRNGSLSSSTSSVGSQGIGDFETVLGFDSRTIVRDTQSYPYRVVGRISSRYDGEPTSCTGTLVGPRTVATAAHCVQLNGVRGTNFTFSPAQQNNLKPFREIEVIATQVLAAWLQDEISENDFAVMTLADDIGSRVGWMAVGFQCDQTPQNLQTAGYPGDRDRTGKTMYTTWCNQTVINACPCVGQAPGSCIVQTGGTFSHRCDTWKGQSGSPLWTEVGNSIQIRGFHSSGQIFSNTATYVGKILFNFLAEYMQNFQ
eukprot:TRINITY_DN18937_c1_g1_i2.p1 TRINITY_DN18937_c1_g1~~TRINITY_DN18937_c1_g1_i2.p1  ORF type:complete len:426 (+),score=30.28 TRINITY_DN18937_c1_g1_i2:1943-3220(+)